MKLCITFFICHFIVKKCFKNNFLANLAELGQSKEIKKISISISRGEGRGSAPEMENNHLFFQAKPKLHTSTHTQPKFDTSTHSQPKFSLPAKISHIHPHPAKIFHFHLLPAKISTSSQNFHFQPKFYTYTHTQPKLSTSTHSQPKISTSSQNFPHPPKLSQKWHILN